MRASYATSSSHPSGRLQHSFKASVQFEAQKNELKRSLLVPIYNAIYGSKVECPEIVMLAKNVERETNKAVPTIMALTLAPSRLHRPLSEALLFWEVGAAMTRAQYPAIDLPRDIDELHELEQQIQCAIDPLQMKWMRRDHSTQVKRAMLERFKEYRRIVDRIIDWLERDLFGGNPS